MGFGQDLMRWTGLMRGPDLNGRTGFRTEDQLDLRRWTGFNEIFRGRERGNNV